MRLLVSTLVMLFLPFSFAFAQAQADAKERAEQIIKQAREALGGEANLAAIKSLQAQGEFKGVLGSRPTHGDFKIEMVMPDKYLRTATASMGPMEITRIEAVNGDQAWLDMKMSSSLSSGGMGGGEGGGSGGGMGGPGGGGSGGGGGMGGSGGGGGMGGGGGRGGRGGARGGGGDGMGAPGGMRGLGAMSPEMEDLMKKQARADFNRFLIAVLLSNPNSSKFDFAYEKEVEAKEGKIDIIKVTGPDDFMAMLFFDQKTHRPAMMAYRAPAPRGPRNAPAQPNTDEEIDGPKLADYQVFFSEHKQEGSVLLPHRIVKATNGQMVEEWKLNKFKINPEIKPNKFEKKK